MYMYIYKRDIIQLLLGGGRYENESCFSCQTHAASDSLCHDLGIELNSSRDALLPFLGLHG